MDDSERAGESQLDCAPPHREGIFGSLNSSANHRIYVHFEVRQLRKPHQFLVENLETLFGNIIGIDVIDAQLKVFQPRLVQLLDFFAREEIAVRDKSCHHSSMPYARNDPL